MPRSPTSFFRTEILFAILALICLGPPLGFVIFHIVSPSDGARLSEGQDHFNAQGAIVQPYSDRGGLLQPGDVVTAVEGVSMETWAGALFTGGTERPEFEFGSKMAYEIIRDGQALEIQVPLGRLPWEAVLSRHWGALTFAFVSQVVAAFVYLNRRDEPAAQALLIWALCGSHTYAWSFFLQVGDVVGGTGFWWFRLATPLLWIFYWPASTHVALTFPSPLPVVRKRLWILPALYAFSVAFFSAGLAWTWTASENLLVWLNSWADVDSALAALFLLATMAVVIRQYTRSKSAAERKQIRWVIYGALISGIGGLFLWLGYPLLTGRSIIDANLLGLLSLPFPVALALAIWRHQLFDIDIIIRRTLQYSVVTLLLAGVYFAGIVLLQPVFQALTGNPESPLITVLTTLGIAALFNPLRRRVQSLIDRAFFRTSYDAEQVLTRFAAAARDEVDLDVLSLALLGAVDESLQPLSIVLWVAGGDKPAGR